MNANEKDTSGTFGRRGVDELDSNKNGRVDTRRFPCLELLRCLDTVPIHANRRYFSFQLVFGRFSLQRRVLRPHHLLEDAGQSQQSRVQAHV